MVSYSDSSVISIEAHFIPEILSELCSFSVKLDVLNLDRTSRI